MAWTFGQNGFDKGSYLGFSNCTVFLSQKKKSNLFKEKNDPGLLYSLSKYTSTQAWGQALCLEKWTVVFFEVFSLAMRLFDFGHFDYGHINFRHFDIGHIDFGHSNYGHFDFRHLAFDTLTLDILT